MFLAPLWRTSAYWYKTAFVKEPDQVVPYKLLPAAVDAMKQVVSARLLLFNGRLGPTQKGALS